MSFLELYNKDVSKFIEKKNNLDYLSWSYAVKELKIAYPEATYKQVYFNNVPYFVDKSGSYVAVKLFLTKEDRKDDFYQDLTFPVLDFKNKTVFEPNSFQVNTAFMRCLTKLIGMATGLGLSLYSGEDIPREEENKPSKKEEKEQPQEVEQPKKNSERLKEASEKGFDFYINFVNGLIKERPNLTNDEKFNKWVEFYKPKSIEIKQEQSKVS